MSEAIPEQSHAQSLQLIRNRLKEKGDMPIFSASVNRVHMVGSDPDADAMALSMEILKDANLTAKVLKLANSPLYNRGLGKIGNLSRAVVVLGFETVKSAALTLKLIDSFQQEHPGIDMTGMLVNAFLSGGFVRGIANQCGMKDIERVYICGLLHNLGDIVVACTLPEQFCRIQTLQREQQIPRIKAEKHTLGATVRQLGQEILNDWEFPQSVIKSLDTHKLGGGACIHNQMELTGALASLANQTMELLYTEHPDSRKSLAELTYELSKVSGIRKEKITDALEQSFRQSCELAQSYGLNKKHLTPRLRGGTDDGLDKLARQFSFYVNSEIEDPQPAVPTTPATPTIADPADAPSSPAAAPSGGNSDQLLGILFEITTLISQQANINSIFSKILEGIQHGAGFDRAVLCLLNPDHTRYSGRLAAGQGADALKDYLNFPLAQERDLFSKIILEGNELLVTDIHQGDWRQQLPADFEQTTGARTFMLSALRSGSRAVGIFYADKALSGTPIGAENHRNFTQLTAQGQLALQMR